MGLLAVALCAVAIPALSTPIEWQFAAEISPSLDLDNPDNSSNIPSEYNYRTLNGTFIYDADTGTASSWSFDMPAWTLYTHDEACLHHPGGVVTCDEIPYYISVPAGQMTSATGSQIACLTGVANCVAFAGPNEGDSWGIEKRVVLQLATASELTDAGGVVPLTADSFLEGTIHSGSGDVAGRMIFANASISADGADPVSAVPEPVDTILIATGLLLLGKSGGTREPHY